MQELPFETEPDEGADALLMAEQERRRSRERIGGAMDKLSERYRVAIRLRLIEELPREECAARLDVTIGTFDVLLYRAVRAFRKHYGDRE
jgi:RNA polymerase sigma-70 factor (ECF subfamily)